MPRPVGQVLSAAGSNRVFCRPPSRCGSGASFSLQGAFLRIRPMPLGRRQAVFVSLLAGKAIPLVCNRGFPGQFATRQRSALLALAEPFSCFLSKRRPAKVIGFIRWMATLHSFCRLPPTHHRERNPSQQPVRRGYALHRKATVPWTTTRTMATLCGASHSCVTL